MIFMKKSKDKKDNSCETPVEKHDTAAWANIEEVKDISHVSIPNQSEVRNAKDWVDSNEK